MRWDNFHTNAEKRQLQKRKAKRKSPPQATKLKLLISLCAHDKSKPKIKEFHGHFSIRKWCWVNNLFTCQCVALEWPRMGKKTRLSVINNDSGGSWEPPRDEDLNEATAAAGEWQWVFNWWHIIFIKLTAEGESRNLLVVCFPYTTSFEPIHVWKEFKGYGRKRGKEGGREETLVIIQRHPEW